MPEVAGEAAVFVDPSSVDQIREAILEIINNETLRKKLIERGLENAKRFSPIFIAQKYAELYERMITEMKK
jgi:glycosyltransferase involved in cell wall biosynthesis